MIPQSQGVQAWDRYAYSNNNPVRYNDPSGHCAICAAFSVAYGFVSSVVNPNAATQQALGIVFDWATGTGDERQEFGPTEPITQEVMQEEQVTQFRDGWKESGYQIPYSTITTVDNRDGTISGMVSSGIGFVKAQFDLGMSLLGIGGSDPSGTHDALEGTLGSFDNISVLETNTDGVVKIVVTNSTGMASFTRKPGTNDSFKKDIARGEGWGGTIYQSFYWYERLPYHTHRPDGK